MDNAAAFDRLIPLLPNSYYYISFDLPGHGKSSHFPPFMPIHNLNFIVAYKLLAAHFQKHSYIIIAHSLGGWIAKYFSMLYPQYVKKLVMIDIVSHIPMEVNQLKEKLTSAIDGSLSIIEKSRLGTKPTYTYKEILAKVQQRTWGPPLTIAQAGPLLERSTEEVGKFTLI